MVFIGIKDGKIVDNTGIMENAIYAKTRWGENWTPEIGALHDEITYIEVSDIVGSECLMGDSWDDVNQVSLKDKPERFAEPEKTPEQQKIDALEARIKSLEDIINGTK